MPSLDTRSLGLDLEKGFPLEEISENVKNLISLVGEEPYREGLMKTPERVAKSYKFLLNGYSLDPEQVLKKAIFNADYNEMVIVKNIDFYSLCEHHMLPFYGKVHLAYIPNGKIVGLSKIPRLVEIFSRRLQIQERLTTQIAEIFQKVITPIGVAVVLEAFHFCIAMRGIEKQNATATTSSMLGVFRDNRATRMEFMELIKER